MSALDVSSRPASASDADRRIRSLRPAKRAIDAFTPQGSTLEAERRPDGTIEQALTVFLSGAECPFTCSFCDLWQYTIDGPTPVGALPAQLAQALREHAGPRPDRIKFYNASNFFDKRAVPSEDVPRIVDITNAYSALTVESHVNTIGPSTLEFARRISSRLEVAVGLETIEPTAASHLNKRLDLDAFARAAGFLREHGIDLRVFVLLGAPYVPTDAAIDWTIRTVEYAVSCGASVVSIIPVRGGNGEIERLAQLGHFTPPTLGMLERALDQSMRLSKAVITADLWDAERLPGCDHCREARVARLHRQNVSGQLEASVACPHCDTTSTSV